jgi:hypothetical protein
MQIVGCLLIGKNLCMSHVYQTAIMVCGKFYDNLWQLSLPQKNNIAKSAQVGGGWPVSSPTTNFILAQRALGTHSLVWKLIGSENRLGRGYFTDN